MIEFSEWEQKYRSLIKKASVKKDKKIVELLDSLNELIFHYHQKPSYAATITILKYITAIIAKINNAPTFSWFDKNFFNGIAKDAEKTLQLKQSFIDIPPNETAKVKIVTKLKETKNPYNPYIHGTNSTIFSILPKSELKIMSPLEMMDQYQVAPMFGEIKKGGYDEVGKELKKEAVQGKTSFGRLCTREGYEVFTLDKIISDYTHSEDASPTQDWKQFNTILDNSFFGGFSTINQLLIYFTRLRQMGKPLNEIFSEEKLSKLISRLEGTIQFYYFLQLLGTHIHPDFKVIEKTGNGKDISEIAYTLLRFENIVNNIINSNIDMKYIVDNPTPNNLQKALAILEFPQKVTIKSGRKQVELSNTQFFCLTADDDNYGYFDNNTDHKVLFRYLTHGSQIRGIHELLEYYLDGRYSANFMKNIGDLAKKHIKALNERLVLFKKLIATPDESFKFSATQHYFLNAKFPIILVTDTSKIELVEANRSEYRSRDFLQLGNEIKTIATDTPANRLTIIKYLEANKVNNVQVILFTDLKESKATGIQPTSAYHHSDGVPTLKWQAAKIVNKKPPASFTNVNFFKKKGLFRDQQTKDATHRLLDDAKAYQAIKF